MGPPLSVSLSIHNLGFRLPIPGAASSSARLLVIANYMILLRVVSYDAMTARNFIVIIRIQRA
jgi:hypothetical protein